MVCLPVCAAILKRYTAEILGIKISVYLFVMLRFAFVVIESLGEL